MAVAHGVSALFLSAMMFYFIQTSIIVAGSVVSKDHSCGRDDDLIALSNYNMEVVFFNVFHCFYPPVSHSNIVSSVKKLMINLSVSS